MLFITVELHLHQLLLLQTNIVTLRYYFLSDEQNLQSSRKPKITPKEQEFIIRSEQGENVPIRLKTLCSAAREMFGQQFKQVATGSPVDHVQRADEVDVTSEKMLLENVTAHFKEQMERHHNSISQMVYNMGRLGGLF